MATEATQEKKSALPPGVIALFWAAAKMHRIGGLVEEVKVAGHIDTPEQEVRFGEHVFMVKEGEEWIAKFIRGSRNFGAAECREVSSLKEANVLTLGQQARKNEVQDETISVNAEISEDHPD